MSDRTRWDLRGPVRTITTHSAERTPKAGDWMARTVARFRPDGQVSETEHHSPDGSVVRHVRVFDDGGKLTEDQWWTNDVLTNRVLHISDAHGRPSSSKSIDAQGTERDTEVRRYGDDGRRTKVVVLHVPVDASVGIAYSSYATDIDGAALSEVTFQDANHALVSRVVFSRDREGHVLSERTEFGDPRRMFGPAIDDMAPDERASLMESLKTVLEDHAFSLTTHTYDAKGRRVETVRRLGRLSEERVTVRYDDFDNPLEEVRLQVNREMQCSDGIVKIHEAPSDVQHVRFEYRYDSHGNWTERTVWHRTEPEKDERPSHNERRTIRYFSD